jgi:hypothetical protein
MATHHAQIERLMREIASHQKNDAAEAKKEADLLAKIHRANEAASRSKVASTIQMNLRNAERSTQDLATVKKKRADLAEKIADRSKSLRNYETRQAQEDERARKKIADEQKKLISDRQAHQRQLSADMLGRREVARSVDVSSTVPVENHDFFISHASEDKDGLVRELAETLRARGARVWYDEFSLKVGDSLRRNIDRGLANSRFGVVVLSEAFFRKEWPQRELDGLVALETKGSTRILPIWHKITFDEVSRYSPTLADKVALNTSLKSVASIADELMSLLI